MCGGCDGQGGRGSWDGQRNIDFLKYFKHLPDPQQRSKVVYPREEALLLCLLAVLGGAETFVDIAGFGEKKIGLLRPVPAFPRSDALTRLPRRYFCDARCR